MMRAVRLACLVLIWLTGGALAQTAVVRSGEHEDFSRLVVYLETPGDFRFGRTEGGYGLRLAGDSARFDLDGVYDLIPRDRLADIGQDPSGALQLAVTCLCNADVFSFRPDVLVIDIRDGAAAPGSVFERPLDGPLAAVPEPLPRPVEVSEGAQADRLQLYWRNQADAPALVGPKSAILGPQAGPALPPSTADPGQDRLVAPAGLTLPDPRITAARDVLLRELGRAATQGLLEIDDPAHLMALAPQPGVARPLPEVPPDQPATAADDPLAHLSITAETAVDRDAIAATPRAVTQDGVACLNDAQLDVAAWGSAEPPAAQIAAARLQLVGEFDAPSAAGVAALAKLYIFLTFGAEAQDTLRAFGATVADADVLRSMAAIMDGLPVAQPGRLAAMTDCATAAAMWSTLAQGSLRRGQPVDRGAVLRSFSALPLALRRHLGPQLSEKFLSVGDSKTATLIRNAITRAAGPHGAGVTVLDARLNLETGNTENAEEALRGVVAEDGTASPEALVVLVESRVARGEPIDPATAQTAAAMAYEYRGTEEGARLARAQILSQAASGAFDPAFAALAALPGAGPTDLTPRVLGELFRVLARTPADADFLNYAFAHADLMTDDRLPRRLELEIAQRLLRLGFPTEARGLLGERNDANEPERLAIGEAYVRERDGAAALRIIAGIDGPEAAGLRGRALTLTGDNAAAAAAFAEAKDTGRQASAAWRAGALAVVRATGSPDQRNAVGALAALGDGARTDAAPADAAPREAVRAGAPGASPTGAPAARQTETRQTETRAATAGNGAAAGSGAAAPAAAAVPSAPAASGAAGPVGGAYQATAGTAAADGGAASGPLARNRALVEESRTSRATLAAVLDAYPGAP